MQIKKTQSQYRQAFSYSFLSAALLLAGCQGGSGGGSTDGGLPPSTSVVEAPSCQAQGRPSYFEELDSSQDGETPDDPTELRARRVRVDIAALKETLLNSNQVFLDVFDDQTLNVEIETLRSFSENNVLITGRLAGDPLSDVTLVINEDAVVAHVHSQKRQTHYQIAYEGEAVHKIQELREIDGDVEDCEALHAPEARVVTNATEREAQNWALAQTPVIDMLVAYTPAARAKLGGKTGMVALIQMGIADTNKSFNASGVNLKVRLVGTMEVAQNDTNRFSPDLSALKGKTDGRWDEIHAERARLGADQVTLVGVYADNGTAGIGCIQASAAYAVSIVKSSSFKAYSFSHELGHNIGLQHSDGYQNSSGGFRTVMAYGSQPRIARFSNPNLDYLGYRTGDANQNSASILNADGSAVASLLLAKLPISNDEAPVITKPPVTETCPE